MCEFYGWTPDIVGGLTFEEASIYWEAITVIEAREMLSQLSVADYPHMKKTSRQKLHRSLSKMAFPATFKDKRRLTLQDLAAMGGSNG